MDGTTVVEKPALPAGPNVATLIDKYIQVRAKHDEWKESVKKQNAQFMDVLEKLGGLLMHQLNSAGVDSMKGRAGTVYKTNRTSATVEKGEWENVLAYIKEKEAWDLLEARVSKNAVLAVIDETGQPIPGVKISTDTVLHVRRS